MRPNNGQVMLHHKLLYNSETAMTVLQILTKSQQTLIIRPQTTQSVAAVIAVWHNFYKVTHHTQSKKQGTSLWICRSAKSIWQSTKRSDHTGNANAEYWWMASVSSNVDVYGCKYSCQNSPRYNFKVNSGMHQGSEAISKEFIDALPLELL